MFTTTHMQTVEGLLNWTTFGRVSIQDWRGNVLQWEWCVEEGEIEKGSSIGEEKRDHGIINLI